MSVWKIVVASIALGTGGLANAQWTTSGSNIYNSNAGSVGVGTTSPSSNYKLHVASAFPRTLHSENTTQDGVGIFGYATHSTSGYGIIGEVTSASGIAIWGRAATTGSGGSYGVYGQSAGTSSVGVFGTNSSSTGTTHGVRGEVYSTSGAALSGLAQANSGTNYGLYAATNSTSGYAVYATGGQNYFGGNTGIGTSSPAAKLHVNGTVRVENLASTTSTTRGALGIDSSNGNVSSRSFATGNGVLTYPTPGSYSWTVPAGVTKIKVRAWGGGAGGTLVPNPDTAGGSGAYVEVYMDVVPGTSVGVTVGAGGDTSGNLAGNGSWSTVSNGSVSVSAGGGYSSTPCPSLPCGYTAYSGGVASATSGVAGELQYGLDSTSGNLRSLPSAATGRIVVQYDSSGANFVFVAPGTAGGVVSGTAWKGADGYVILEY